MGSRVDKSPLFHRNKQVFHAWHYLRMIPCRVQKLFENWENSRAMMKRNWSEFFSVLEVSTCWFFVSTREAKFFVFSHHFWVSLEIALSFFLEKEFSENQQNYQLAIPGLSSIKFFSDSLCEWRSWSNWAGLDSACFRAKTNEQFPISIFLQKSAKFL